MPHFSDRYKNENLIIFDEKRLKAGIYNKNEWYLSKIDKRIYDKFKDEEEIYEKMWREYFNSISIDDRKNLKAQFQFVPYRYRKNITEFNK
jgi:probable DNA metabolism protein